MADHSKIEWTDATWTPIRARNLATGKVGWHCEHVTPGCEHCYAETMNGRLGTGLPFKPGHRKDIELFLDETMLTQPLRWKKPRMIFVCSMTDLFATFVCDEWIDQIFAVMALAPQHTFQVLTKRPERMQEYVETKRRDAPQWVAMPSEGSKVLLPYEGGWPKNVWLGTSVEDQARANERIPELLATPAAVRFISAEPLLGPVDLHEVIPDALTHNFVHDRRGLDWVIVGGESGPDARPMHPDWARSLRDQCAAAGVAFHFKQHGEWVDADHYRAQCERDGTPALGMAEDENVCRPLPPGPLSFDNAARMARADARRPRWEHHSDGHTMIRIGKKAAGRLLDGVEHNGMPK